jgi:hypothetical protein
MHSGRFVPQTGYTENSTGTDLHWCLTGGKSTDRGAGCTTQPAALAAEKVAGVEDQETSLQAFNTLARNFLLCIFKKAL